MSEKDVVTRVLTDTLLTRRTFLKWSAALGGTAALANSGLDLGLKFNQTAQAATTAAPKEAKWVSVACWHNCGGRCVNYALVQDGVVMRQKRTTRTKTPRTFHSNAVARVVARNGIKFLVRIASSIR